MSSPLGRISSNEAFMRHPMFIVDTRWRTVSMLCLIAGSLEKSSITCQKDLNGLSCQL